MIEIKGISKAFGDKKIFEDYSLQIKDGEFVVFAGESGCGKTTLLNMIGGLEKADQGEILIDGRNVFSRKGRRQFYAEKVGFLFQNFALVESKSVRDNLEFIQKSARSGVSLEEALEEVGLKNEAKTPVFQLSGGEQQRVALARLIFKKCDVILADEPTGSLDPENANRILSLLRKLQERGKTVILVTHDTSIIKNAPRVEYLKKH